MQSDRYSLTRKASYLGYVIQAVVNNILSLLFVVFNRAPYNISVERLGRLVFLNFIAQLVVDFLSVYIVPRFGYKKCVVAAQASSVLGFILLGFLPIIIDPYTGIVIAIILLAIGSGFIEVLISPIIEALPSDNKAGSMSFLHSFYCWGQVITVFVTTLLLLVIGRNNWYYLPFIWSVLPIINTELFSKANILELNTTGQRNKGRFIVLKNKNFYFYLILMFCAGASEISMVQWSSFFVEVGFSAPKWLGDLLGPCMFAVLMGLGRMFYAIFGSKIPLLKSILGTSAFCVVCYLLVAFSNNPIISLIGCAFCGLSVSLMWPGVLSLSAEKFAYGGAAMFSMLAMFGDLGCAVGPWFLGLVSDTADASGLSLAYANALNLSGSQTGLQFGFLINTAFPLFMVIIMSLWLIGCKRKSSCN